MNPIFTRESESMVTMTVDDLMQELQIDHIHLMKIDVEGHERLVFEGMRNMLNEHKVDKIIFEFCDWMENMVEGYNSGSAQQLLKNKGFSLSLFTDCKLKLLPDVLRTGDATLVAAL